MKPNQPTIVRRPPTVFGADPTIRRPVYSITRTAHSRIYRRAHMAGSVWIADILHVARDGGSVAVERITTNSVRTALGFADV